MTTVTTTGAIIIYDTDLDGKYDEAYLKNEVAKVTLPNLLAAQKNLQQLIASKGKDIVKAKETIATFRRVGDEKSAQELEAQVSRDIKQVEKLQELFQGTERTIAYWREMKKNPEYVDQKTLAALPAQLRPYAVLADHFGDGYGVPSDREMAELMLLLDPDQPLVDSYAYYKKSKAETITQLKAAGYTKEAFMQALKQAPASARKDELSVAIQGAYARDLIKNWIVATATPSQVFLEDSGFFSIWQSDGSGTFLDTDRDGLLERGEVDAKLKDIDTAITTLQLKLKEMKKPMSPAAKASVDAYLGQLLALKETAGHFFDGGQSQIRYMEPDFYKLPEEDRAALLDVIAQMGKGLSINATTLSAQKPASATAYIADGAIDMGELFDLPEVIANLQAYHGYQPSLLEGVFPFLNGHKNDITPSMRFVKRLEESKALRDYLRVPDWLMPDFKKAVTPK